LQLAAVWLIVGLGNPGAEYEDTYHNVGFRVVKLMADRFGVRIKERCGPALISSRVTVAGADAVLVMPQTFMNLSGSALPKLFERFETSARNVIAVYDEVALPVGKIRIRQKGSAGGHNGVKSLISACGTDEFFRVRVGILPERFAERPLEERMGMRDFVLSRVAKSDRALLDEAEVEAANAVEMLIAEGVDNAMAKFNRLDLREAKED
jgi:PTH1 family peptidyl-tRNA hydrolase